MGGWGSDWTTHSDNPWPTKEQWEKHKQENPFDKSLYEQQWFLEDKAEMAKAEQDAMLCGQGWTKITEDGVKHIPVTETAPISKEAWDNLKPLNIPKFLNNKPTHDPYTNPNAHIYYECGCGAILDPGTKSFAQLNNCASEAGWKIRWGADSYVPYCVRCGEDVE